MIPAGPLLLVLLLAIIVSRRVRGGKAEAD